MLMMKMLICFQSWGNLKITEPAVESSTSSFAILNWQITTLSLAMSGPSLTTLSMTASSGTTSQSRSPLILMELEKMKDYRRTT